MDRAPRLPGILGEIADVAGVEAARAVAKARGGCRAYFVAKPLPDNWLVELVGMELAEAIGAELAPAQGGLELEVPYGPASSRVDQWGEIYRRLGEGQTQTEIAKAHGITRRTVQYHANGHRPLARMWLGLE
ncbi:MAG: helix-turn-helix transcriptional regulator [Pseudomonadota bacterium]